MREPNQRRNVYAGLALNRAAERRRDANWLADRLADPRTRILPVWRERNLIRRIEPGVGGPVPTWLDPIRAQTVIVETSELVFLGVDGEIAHFALSLSHLEEPDALASVGPDAELAELRSIGTLLHERDAALLAYSRAITTWHQRHRFCGVCGNPTSSDEGGHVRRCIDEKCGASHFPRTDPAVIMAIEHGNRLLLGRQREWPPGMHSVLAGFVEPGESLEETVAREILEEAGLTVTDIRYHSSQPWPFPASIMLGFTGRATDDTIRIVEPEFEHIGWYDRRFLASSPEDDRFKLPSHHSIARRLVEDWIAEGD
jgi:NAD+ diphosphatase